MGEEEKKVETVVDKKKEDGPGKDEKKDGGEKKKADESGGGGGEEEEKKKDDPPPPPPPKELIMRVYMHCEGCARKVKRSLRGFEGVEDVQTDCRTHTVVVKGIVPAADPLKVVERVEKKIGRKVELLTPIPPKPEKVEKVEEEPESKPDEVKEQPKVVSVVLKVNMHCEACSQEIKKRILKMKGVETVEPMLKSSEVLVKGVFDPPKVVEYIYKRTGKHAVVVKVDPDPEAKAKTDEKDGKADEKKGDGGGDGEGGGDGGKKEAGGGEKDGKEGGGVSDEAMAAAAMKMVEMKRNEYYYHYPRYAVEHAYPPQIFSDENPNACSVM